MIMYELHMNVDWEDLLRIDELNTDRAQFNQNVFR